MKHSTCKTQESKKVVKISEPCKEQEVTHLLNEPQDIERQIERQLLANEEVQVTSRQGQSGERINNVEQPEIEITNTALQSEKQLIQEGFNDSIDEEHRSIFAGQEEYEGNKDKRVEENEPSRGRKRIRNVELWARNVKKRLRNSGEQYISSRGKQIKGRSIKPCCPLTCPLKCSTKFDERDRKEIFEDYWALGDKREQQHFIVRHVEERTVTRKRVGSEKRNTTCHYFLNKKESNSREQVCRTFFLNTMDIGRDFVYNTIRKVSGTGTLKGSLQGKHGCQPKINESLIKEVENHIKSFKVIDSHYCRKDSKRQYLDPSLSVKAMYRLYCINRDEQSKERVSEDMYRKVFDRDPRNLWFHCPKKDQCDNCIAYKNHYGPVSEEVNFSLKSI